MVKLNKVVRKILKEAAGISFEVRAWAKIIESHVNNLIQQEKDKIKTKQASTTEPKSQDDNVFGIDNTDDEWDYGFTHFVFADGSEQIADVAYIYGDELWINSDVMEDFQGIEKEIKGKLFKVDMNGDGSFDVVPSNGTKITSYDFLPGIMEVIEDHMLKGEPFYTDSYDLVYATSFDESDKEEYYKMYEESGNRGGWSNGWSSEWGGLYHKQPKIDLVEIDGSDYPEAYTDFKVDKWIITNSDRIEYDHWKSGYDKNGKYVVYLNMPMGSIGGTMLVHEIKHAYDDWNRISSGAPAIRDGWEIQNIYTKDFEKLVLGGAVKYSMLSPIVRYYYLGSKLESPAYLENEFDSSAMGYRDTAKQLMNFKASRYLNKQGEPAKGLQEMWVDMLLNYDIPFFRKFSKVVDFLGYTEKYFNKRGRNIINRIDKMKYIHGKPMSKPTTPKVYPTRLDTTKPTKQTTNVSPTEDTTKLYEEIDKVEEEIDGLHMSGFDNNKEMIESLEKYLDHLYSKVDNITGNDIPY